MAIDSKKRNTLKVLRAAGAASVLPMSVSLAHSNTAPNLMESINKVSAPSEPELVISFTDVQGRTGTREVIITNMGTQSATVSQINPGIVSTQHQHYDLNSLFANGPLHFTPKEAKTFRIRQLDALMVNQSIRPAHSVHDPELLKVSVRTHEYGVNFGEPVVTQRSFVA